MTEPAHAARPSRSAAILAPSRPSATKRATMEAAPSRSQGYKGTDPSARSNARHLGSGDTVPGSHQLAEGSEANECSMVFQDVKALHSLLQCLKSGGKQVRQAGKAAR